MVLTIRVSVRDKELLKKKQDRYRIFYSTKSGRKFAADFKTKESIEARLRDFILGIYSNHGKFKVLRERAAFGKLKSEELIPIIKKMKSGTTRSFKLI